MVSVANACSVVTVCGRALTAEQKQTAAAAAARSFFTFIVESPIK